ncbi:4-(cytidine 5'-diphospho)-2-C-methyl-D-erythritol kinase [Paraglaciecola hydrolytica]|uniref:4-diphosphocytidyl-2-C-methyl-D-erythritol kinase n=1 Tax=Paraglaciecola hydrolytica TaxID=1799789 RepID=A0A136A692_9ALTE|nr:4-(cytidine 5'-diphospho)-2-C-methyl-D-erythritol kinase [Paraglaciecola hydrolytica]KXI30749.1 4-(cytidine 5'-diphospho)-2-C-methyl-D-erythritol kinase [Paraglaciecola hydrolytica]
MLKQWWPSPAKLNLFLHINGRYANGYHQLQSVFQLLDFGDELAFEIDNSGKIALCTPIEGVEHDDNLIVKAARLLQQHIKVQHANRDLSALGCKIYLKKRLPMGGGIGGGSSNAATTLVVLNKLWHGGLNPNELANLGLQLGADVPIFVMGDTAFAEGVGEKLQPFTVVPATYLVVFPDCHVSTQAVFTHVDLPRNTAKISANDYQFDNTHNDCQELVCELYPNVAKTLHWLLEYAPSRMTGTGSCVFAVFKDAAQATKVQKLLPEGSISFIAAGLSRSPLHQLLDAQPD